MTERVKVNRVFLVDDEPLILRALHRVMRQEGYETQSFEGAEQALAAMQDVRPDCVISDYYMPKTDGLAFLQKVKEMHPYVIRVLLTGGHIDQRIREALAGKVVQLLIQKPWQIESIRELMEDIRQGKTTVTIDKLKEDKVPRPDEPIPSPVAMPEDVSEDRPIILVVDDDPAFNELMKVWLSRLGYDPVTSPAAEPALELTRDTRPDLLIADLILPAFDGFALMGAFRDLYPRIPIIGITGGGERDLAIEAFRQGATAFLHKPLELDTLEATIRRCLQFSSLFAADTPNTELSILLEMQHAISSEIRSDRLLHLLLQQMIRYTQADAASILLLDEGGETMSIVASYGLDKKVVKDEQVSVGQGIVGWVVEHNEPQLIVGEAPDDPRLVGKSRIRAATVGMVMPIRGPKGVVGAMCITRLEGKEPFTRGALDLGLLLGGEVARVIVRSDAAEQRMDMERSLMRRDKLVTIGELASGVAHEINNPLGYVSSNVSSLNDYIKDLLPILQPLASGQGSEVEKALHAAGSADLEYILGDLPVCIRETMDGVSRVLKIVSDLKTFARDDTELKEPEDLNKILDSAVGILWNQIKYKAELVREYSELPEFPCYPSQLAQVFLNLLYNAAQSIERDGRIYVRTRLEGGMVVVEVEDNGEGIEPDKLQRIFEPFFTTKPRGVGTGLGLSIAQKIVRRHDGQITVVSKQGKGSLFRVEMPLLAGRSVLEK